jgi:hypothetical protein
MANISIPQNNAMSGRVNCELCTKNVPFLLLRDFGMSLLMPVICVRCGYRDAIGVYGVRLVRVWRKDRTNDVIRYPV